MIIGRLAVIGALLLLGLVLPEAGWLGAFRASALYVLAAWVPGLVVWRVLAPRTAGLAESVVIPSCLSPIAFTSVAIGALALGASPLAAALIALAPFLLLAVLREGVRPRLGELPVVLGALGLSALLLGVPFAANDFTVPAWDAPMHAAIASRIKAGHVPPDSPWVAGQAVNYYWFYHAHATAISALTGLGSYRVFALLNLHFLVVLVLASYRLASRLTADARGRWLASGLVVFGVNPFGWVFFLQGAARDPGRWFSLSVPIEMVRGYPAALAGMVHEFVDGNPFPLAFPLMVVWLDLAAGWLGGKRDREAFGVGVLVLLAILHIHLFTAVFFLAAAGVATAVSCGARRDPARLRGALGLLGMVLAALLCTLPYAASVLGQKSGLPVTLDLGPPFVGRQLLAITASVGLLLLLAVPAIRLRPVGSPGAVLFVGSHAVVLLLGASVLRMAGDTQYKLHYLAALALAPLAGAASGVWARTGPLRAAAFALLLLCVPTSAITSYAFLTQPPRDHVTAEQRELFRYIRESTPEESAFVEAEYWLPLRRSAGDFLYYDRLWFDIPIYAGRRRFAGYYDEVLVDLWGYRDIPLRRRISKLLLAGSPLAAADRSYLEELGLPLFVIVRGPRPPAPPAFDPQTYALAYERPEVSVFRLLLSRPERGEP